MQLLRSALAFLLPVALLLGAVPVQASPWSVRGMAAGAATSGGPAPSAEARAEWEQGSNAYALGNYEEAVLHFERSYELSQEPALLFDVGQAYSRWYELSDDVAHLRKALKLYENYQLYLDGATDSDPARIEQAKTDTRERVAAVEALIAEHEARADGQTGEPKDPDVDEGEKKPLVKRGWFWGTIVGVLVVAGGVTAAVLLTRPDDDEFDPELGTIGARPLGPGIHF